MVPNMPMLTAGSRIHLLSFELGPAKSLRTAVGSEELGAVAMDAPVSLSPLSSSAAPERIFGGNGFGVFVLLRMCCTVFQLSPIAMRGHSKTHV